VEKLLIKCGKKWVFNTISYILITLNMV
jgi:hypothetical protein